MIALLKIMRPHHWVKNLFLFAPLFFSGEIFAEGKILKAFYAFAVFSLIASGVYILNDWMDLDEDRRHPKKKHRPIASNKIGIRSALFLSLVLFTGGGILLKFKVAEMTMLLSLYVVLNLFYSLFLKRIPIVDVLTVSSFYLIRIAAGGIVTQILVSKWLILCTLFLSLFLICAKRKAECKTSKEPNSRKVLRSYSPALMDHFLIITAGLTLISYGLYTILGTTEGTAVYSIYFVVLGIFRYFSLIDSPSAATTESPETLIFSDKIICVTIVTWMAYMYFIFYRS